LHAYRHPRSVHKVDGAPNGDWQGRKRRVLGGTVAVDDAFYQVPLSCCNTLQHTATLCNTLRVAGPQEVRPLSSRGVSLVALMIISHGTECVEKKMISLFCRISPLLQGSFAKETCTFKEPTNRSQPISEQPPCVENERGPHQISSSVMALMRTSLILHTRWLLSIPFSL